MTLKCLFESTLNFYPDMYKNKLDVKIPKNVKWFGTWLLKKYPNEFNKLYWMWF